MMHDVTIEFIKEGPALCNQSHVILLEIQLNKAGIIYIHMMIMRHIPSFQRTYSIVCEINNIIL